MLVDLERYFGLSQGKQIRTVGMSVGSEGEQRHAQEELQE